MHLDQTKHRKRIYPPIRRWGSQIAVILVVLVPCALTYVLQSQVAPGSFGTHVGLKFTAVRLLMLLAGLGACIPVIPYYLVRRMRPEIVAKVKSLYGVDAADAPMVGFSPGSDLKLHSGDTASDFGLLVLDPDRMSYFGDTLTFSLIPSQIESVSAAEQNYLGLPVPRVLIGWRETPTTPLQGFVLEAWDASTLWQSRQAAADLLQRIERWRQVPIA